MVISLFGKFRIALPATLWRKVQLHISEFGRIPFTMIVRVIAFLLLFISHSEFISSYSSLMKFGRTIGEIAAIPETKERSIIRTAILELLLSKIECNDNISLNEYLDNPYLAESDRKFITSEYRLLLKHDNRTFYYWPNCSDSIIFGNPNGLVSIQQLEIPNSTFITFIFFAIDIRTVNSCIPSRRTINYQYSQYPQIIAKPHALIYDSRFVIGIPVIDSSYTGNDWIYLGRDYCEFDNSRSRLIKSIAQSLGVGLTDSSCIKKYIEIDSWADYEPYELRYVEHQGQAQLYRFRSRMFQADFFAKVNGNNITYSRVETPENLSGLVLNAYESRYGPHSGSRISFVRQERKNFIYKIELMDGETVNATYSVGTITFDSKK